MNNLTKNKKFIFMLVCTITLVLTSSSCEKDAPKNCCNCTASAAASGANTVSFDLDGVTWSPCNAVNAEGKAPEITAERYRLFGYDRITIMASQKITDVRNDNFVIIINYPNIGKVSPGGGFPNGSLTLEYIAIPNRKYYGFYKSHKDLPFNLEVTRFDTINKMISGVFDCDVRKILDSSDSTIIHLTNGRFDVRYN